ncbi:hypothetical protein M9H77_03384 [Catharanthus roseus]|uniref:Uncharacterized protein n=1 Tax=Catharanthus roseus TaxID=4058 RepID=A0ACC0CB58_CATRO|nr:hypothetical protein M9H77_03384 [Catharanthus roseus]
MVRPSGRKRDDGLGPVTNRTGRVEGRTITASSRGLRGQYSTYDLPSTPNPLPAGFHYDTCASGSSTQPSPIPFTSQSPLPSHLSHTHGFESDRGLGEESDKVRSLHIEGEADERVDDDGNGDDDDQDDGEDAGDEEQPVPVAPASGFDERPHHEKGKELTDSFMSIMSKISGSRNKRPDVAREVLAPTQRRKKVKASDWEQTGPVEGGHVDLELIPSYSGHVAGPIWHGQDRGLLKC